jgi:hypothetical protein
MILYVIRIWSCGSSIFIPFKAHIIYEPKYIFGHISPNFDPLKNSGYYNARNVCKLPMEDTNMSEWTLIISLKWRRKSLPAIDVIMAYNLFLGLEVWGEWRKLKVYKEW